MPFSRNFNSKRKNSQNIFISPLYSVRRLGGVGLFGESEEVDVFEIGVVLSEAVAGIGVAVNANFVQAADEVRGDDVEVGIDRGKFGVGADDFAPEFAAERVECFGGRAFDQEL